MFSVALSLRSCFLIDDVFRADYVSFQENDPWYHVRVVEHLVENFPHRLTWDPYALHPGGQYVAVAPLFDWTAAALALILGAGAPSPRLIHTVCAWLPAVLGALTVVPVYFLGKRLHDRQAGFIAAATLPVLPGPFLRRSLLGYADHHAAESLLAVLAVLFLIHTVRASPLHKGGHRGVAYAILCGLCLGCYLLVWVGGSLLVLALSVALMFHLLYEHARRRSVAQAYFLIVLAWGVAVAVLLPFPTASGAGYSKVALAASGLYFVVLATLAWVLQKRPQRGLLLPFGMATLAIGGLVMLWLVTPVLFDQARQGVRRFVSGGAGSFIVEARPLLYVGDSFTLRPVMEMFQAAAATAILGGGILLYRIVRDKVPGGFVFLVWTVCVVLATLVQERFGYYLAVNVALLSGFFWSALLGMLGRKFTGLSPSWRWAAVGSGYALLLAIGLYPSAARSIVVAQEHTGPHPDWRDAMTWLRENSVAPFDDSNYFNERYDALAESPRPQSGYGVMGSWDHGYWIAAMARRVPTANPTQSGLRDAAAFFAVQNEESAALILKRLSARYVVVDDTLPVWHSAEAGDFVGAFGTIARLGGHDEFELYEPYFAPNEDGTYKPIVAYYPEYYRSMLNRLYLFGGQEYVPEWSTWAVRYSTVATEIGEVKRIDQGLKFRTYDMALEFVTEHGDEPWRIVGLSHAESCVPLEPLHHFRRVYQSPTKTPVTDLRSTSVVEIFEFTSEALDPLVP